LRDREERIGGPVHDGDDGIGLRNGNCGLVPIVLHLDFKLTKDTTVRDEKTGFKKIQTFQTSRRVVESP